MVKLSGLTIAEAQALLASRLKAGGYVTAPDVNVGILEFRGYQVTVLGHVGKAGRYPLESRNTRLSDILAIAGGVEKDGSDVVVLSGIRDGKPFRREYLVSDMGSGSNEDDPRLAGGDRIFVPPAPIFYITGEVKNPGSYRLERGMTLSQALAASGGLTNKASRSGPTLKRATPDKKVQVITPGPDDVILPNDVITVKEGLF
jgi:polysaccharide export outer membrane protein